MLDYLLAITGLAAACGGWILFQRWLNKLDPEHDSIETGSRCGGCGGCSQVTEDRAPPPH